MSYVGLVGIDVHGGEPEQYPDEPDGRVKVEFIGDSLTCGYGIHSVLSEDNYTLWDEDGEDCYAAIMAEQMNWNARWISASGYGAYISYDGNRNDNVPKLYPYVNWFLDKELRIDQNEFEPEYIFINLGTNDSGHLHKAEVLDGFKESYERFLRELKELHPDAKIICIIGTVCKNVYQYIEDVVKRVSDAGLKDIYSLELPYHTPETDGIADGHPTLTTHRKDASRILKYMKTEKLLQ